MKVLLLNGSPDANGTTYRALEEVTKTLNDEGIETQIFQIGKKPITGCIACYKCAELGHCVFGNDGVNEFVELAEEADGFVFGTPVHYAAASGAITSFLDRAFFSAMQSEKKPYYLKPGASVAVARRAGTTATYDQINKYLTISEMPVISASYWNNVFGTDASEAEKDEEGLRTMRVLAKNMAWFLKCKEAGAKAGIEMPRSEASASTNFI